jgi:uncharacterized membrane protein YoaK (UPF0700 family)
VVSSEDQNARLATLFSFNGGYIDAAAHLALHGLFTTHVPGNFTRLSELDRR